ncbi:hypothetical protein RRG08_059975 [Elysia crispata]|uniref:Uncharacterized protein n=1 Tax=Elysia crispata TaxID=231223 RepID=A0AAE1A8N1_9GAST|nr:hypothetical protein RRG08_059975 [Elysia crispata]
MRNVAFTPEGDHITWTQLPTDSINTICVHNRRLCYQLSSVIVSLGPSVVFGYRGILLIFLAYETQDSLWHNNYAHSCCGKSLEIQQHPKRDGQMVKSLTASLVSREEEERHQRNLNDDEQLKNQIALSHHITGYCKAPVVYNVVGITVFAFPLQLPNV